MPIPYPRVRSGRLLAIGSTNTQYPITDTKTKCNSKSMLLVAAASSQKRFVLSDRAKNGLATGIRF